MSTTEEYLILQDIINNIIDNSLFPNDIAILTDIFDHYPSYADFMSEYETYSLSKPYDLDIGDSEYRKFYAFRTIYLIYKLQWKKRTGNDNFINENHYFTAFQHIFRERLLLGNIKPNNKAGGRGKSRRRNKKTNRKKSKRHRR